MSFLIANLGVEYRLALALSSCSSEQCTTKVLSEVVKVTSSLHQNLASLMSQLQRCIIDLSSFKLKNKEKEIYSNHYKDLAERKILLSKKVVNLKHKLSYLANISSTVSSSTKETDNTRSDLEMSFGESIKSSGNLDKQ